jgi:catechol 2,3-dioxygenase-like lactoylglutathione lyase family enzyme
MQIEGLVGLDHVAFATEDFDRTRELCEHVLGLEPIPSLATGSNRYRIAWYRDKAGTEYHVAQKLPDLAEALGTDFNPSLYSHAAFEVENIDDAKSHLASLGFGYHEWTGHGISSRRQIYVLLEDEGLMLELFENRKEVEPVYVPPEATR